MKYILSYPWGLIASDKILPTCTYYAEVKVADKKELGYLKRCSTGSKAEQLHLMNIFWENKVIRNVK